MREDGTAERWYAVHCKPRQEAVAEEHLRRQGFHGYLPSIRVRRLRHGQWLEAVEALFPRYVFIRVDPLRRSIASVRSTRGVIDLVRFGGQPAAVPEGVIETLRQREEAAAAAPHRDDHLPLRAGEQVKLVEGPLAGMEGIFTQEDGDKRVILLLELLGKANKISVRHDWVAQIA